ncbi:hypothetical protein LCGC14_0373360 [marine sediment metagenome]|uniref:Uncharacterized protein n=1 Tax=marine sediment metagenome TaxID=412755 RepID=A0A0F9VRN5_9ZZZZ
MNDKRVLVFAMNAIVHLKEYIDSGEPLDLAAANGVLNGPEVRAWIEDNKILLPLRRDGKKLNE